MANNFGITYTDLALSSFLLQFFLFSILFGNPNFNTLKWLPGEGTEKTSFFRRNRVNGSDGHCWWPPPRVSRWLTGWYQTYSVPSFHGRPSSPWTKSYYCTSFDYRTMNTKEFLSKTLNLRHQNKTQNRMMYNRKSKVIITENFQETYWQKGFAISGLV